MWKSILGGLIARKSDMERFGKYIADPERIAYIRRGHADTYVPAVVRRDWVVLVPAVARTVLFVVLVLVWYPDAWRAFIVVGVFLALHANRRGLLHGSTAVFFWVVVQIGVVTYLALAVLQPLSVWLQILVVVFAALLWVAHDCALWFYDVLVITNLNLYREFLDAHGLEYEYRKACGDLRSFTYNEPRLPLLTWRIWGEIFRRPDLGIMHFESAVQFDRPLNYYGPITHVNSFRTQFVAIRENKMRGHTPPPITPL